MFRALSITCAPVQQSEHDSRSVFTAEGGQIHAS